MVPGNSLCHDISCSPGCLEVKAARDTIDIEDLSCKEDAGEVFAFQGVGIDSRETDTPAGDKLILESCTTGYLIVVVAETVRQAVQVLLCEMLPAILSPFS